MEYVIVLVVCCLLAALAGFVGGSCWMREHFTKKYTIGELRVDHSDKDGPFCFMEVYPDCGDFINRKAVMLLVRKQDFLPQK